MSYVKVTRRELLARVRQRKLADRGVEVLEEKRRLLIRELSAASRRLIRESGELTGIARAAATALAEAQIRDGPAAVRAAALASSPFNLEVEKHMDAGVEIPLVRARSALRAAANRGYGLLGSSGHIDAAARSYERELDLVVQLAILEGQIRVIVRELSRTSRRVNALNEYVLPRLDHEIRGLRTGLEEREREDFLRLKRVVRAQEARSV